MKYSEYNTPEAKSVRVDRDYPYQEDYFCPECTNSSEKCTLITQYPVDGGMFVLIYRCKKCNTVFHILS